MADDNALLAVAFHIDDGIDMLDMLEQSLKANSPIDSSLSGKNNFAAPLQPSNALQPIVLVSLGIIISGKSIHPLKEESPILLRLFPHFKVSKL